MLHEFLMREAFCQYREGAGPEEEWEKKICSHRGKRELTGMS